MKTYAILIIGVVMFSCEKKSTIEFPNENFGSMVEIRNQNLKGVLNDYFHKNLSEEDYGVITVDFRNNNDTSTFIIYSALSLDLRKSPPSHYTVLGKVPVLFYTGLERYILFDSLYLDNLDKDVSRFLEDYIVDEKGNILQMPPSYNPAVWKVEIVEDSIIKIEYGFDGSP